jgi:hypothetical protein
MLDSIALNLPKKENALIVSVIFKNKQQVYVGDDKDVKLRVISRSNDIVIGLGLDYPVTLQTPLYLGIQVFLFLIYFLNEVPPLWRYLRSN